MSIAEVAARVPRRHSSWSRFAACTAPSGDDAPLPGRAATRATLPDPPATEFDPGFIVSDDSFYDSSAMTEDEIQAFLESVPTAGPTTACRASTTTRQTTTTQPAVGGAHCAEYRGGIRERASRIIAKAAAACGVSPRTLLVLLQKEQSLLTRPSESGYLRATGYGCPDTADCDTKYFGFFNQVYNAAWQFRQYTEEPDRAVPDRHGPGAGTIPTRRAAPHPSRSRNQATANLYNYTPYQPNAATIADPETGDACWGVRQPELLAPLAPLVRRPPGRAATRASSPPCSRLVGGHPCPCPSRRSPRWRGSRPRRPRPGSPTASAATTDRRGRGAPGMPRMPR